MLRCKHRLGILSVSCRLYRLPRLYRAGLRLTMCIAPGSDMQGRSSMR
jgi:hypothetical protein